MAELVAYNKMHLSSNCVVCGEASLRRNMTRERCSTCYAYWVKHKVDRPEALWNPVLREESHQQEVTRKLTVWATPCWNCGDTDLHAYKGQCLPCWAHWYITARVRQPGEKVLKSKFWVCLNCKSGGDVAFGRCPECLAHFQRADPHHARERNLKQETP